MTNLQPSNVQTFQLGLIGHPLGHSLSPRIHAAALQACGLEGDYALFPIRPEDEQGLQQLLKRVRAGELQGLNVTIPHKQNVMPFLDDLTATAQAVGAVNTIYLRENKLVGDNTDATGFLMDLKKFVDRSTSPSLGEGPGVREKSALVLGAGGSARAVVYALATDGWQVMIAARRLEQAQQLTSSLSHYQLQITAFSDLQLSTFNLMVNTTPLGMHPEIDQSPLPEDMTLPPELMVYDLVYNPRETKLVRDARAQGLHAVTGLGMLVEQAALAFELWTGRNPPREKLWAAVENGHKSLIAGD